MLNPRIYKITCPDCYFWLTDSSVLDEKSVQSLLAQLDETSIRRYNNILKKERRNQFLISRLLLKLAISTFLEISEDQVGIIECPDHKPRLALSGNVNSLPFFSIAHSGKWVGCVVARNAIGLDLEIRNPDRKTALMARFAFNASENKWLQLSPECKNITVFYQLWTRKEALFKLLSEKNTNDHNLWQKTDIFKEQYNWHIDILDQGNLFLAICSCK